MKIFFARGRNRIKILKINPISGNNRFEKKGACRGKLAKNYRHSKKIDGC